jgi:hypothetical protein
MVGCTASGGPAEQVAGVEKKNEKNICPEKQWKVTENNDKTKFPLLNLLAST